MHPKQHLGSNSIWIPFSFYEEISNLNHSGLKLLGIFHLSFIFSIAAGSDLYILVIFCMSMS